MSQAERIKETLGWLKVVFAALVAVDVSLYCVVGTKLPYRRECHSGARACRRFWHYGWHRCGKSRGLSPSRTDGELVMLWALVTAVVIFIGGMLIVAYEASTAGSK
jgi:hypothetical protein